MTKVKNCAELAKSIRNNEAEFLELVYKMTGGAICLSSITDFLIEEGFVSNKVRNVWFHSYMGESIEEFSNKHGYYTVRIPNGMTFKGINFDDTKASVRKTINTMLMISQLAGDKKKVTRIMMGVDKVSGITEEFSFASNASVAAHFRKYFGQGMPIVEKLKDVRASDVPEYISLANTKLFWECYLGDPKNWKTNFVESQNPDGENNTTLSLWLENDSNEQRTAARKKLTELFSA